MKRTRRTASCLLALAVGASAAAVAQGPPSPEPARAEVLVLGTYHMANPGHDIFNLESDDVLSPRRQAEIVELIEVLKRFRPTKIAIESGVWSDRRTKEYAEYVAGEHVLGRNEIEQIGFRLAHELGHETVYPVDVDGEFPYQRVVNYARASGRSAELDALAAETGESVKRFGAYLSEHSVLEALLDLNSARSVARDMAFYERVAGLGEPGDWAGADLVADWFRRNVRIYANILQLVDSPAERILVVYGAGHLGWLRREIDGNPDLRLRTLSELVE